MSEGVRDRSARAALGRALRQGLLALASAGALAPTAFMAMTALKTDAEWTLDKVGPPSDPTLEHFRTVLFGSDFGLWMLNSATLALLAVAVSTAVAALAAYPLARMEFVGRRPLMVVVTALMAVPPVVLIVPLFVLHTRLGLVNSVPATAVIYAGLVAPFSTYLLATFFRTVPQEIVDAAVIDGASDLQVLTRVLLPLSAAPLVTLAVVNALFVWNDLLIAVIFLQDDARRTLMAGIAVFQGRFNDQVPLVMAGMLVAAAPMLLLYLLFQRHLVRGMLAGAVK